MGTSVDQKLKELAAGELKADEFIDEKELEELRKSKQDPNKVFDKRRSQAVDDDEKGGDSVITKSAKDDKTREFQAWNDDLYIISKMLRADPRHLRQYQKFQASALAKAMYNVAGAGAEWIPTGFSADLMDRVVLECKVANLFDRFDMPTSPYKWPLRTAGVTAYKLSEAADEPESATKITASTGTTSNVTFTAVKLGGRTTFSEELSEDSIVAVLPSLKKDIVLALAEGVETAIISGDSDRTLDVGVGTTDVRAAWKGLRKLCLTAAKVDISSFAYDKLIDIRKKMGKYGVDPSKLAWVVGPSGYAQLQKLTDNATNARLVITVEQYGPSAPIVTGEMGRLAGIPIIVSEKVPENLNDSGLYDGTTMDKTVVLLVYRPGWKVGDRRKVSLKTDENIETDQTVLVATQRLDFQRMLASTEKVVGLGYKLSS